jgi:hypothetical protein
MHLTPEGFPSGIPGIKLDIDIAMQQAPHFSLQSIIKIKDKSKKIKVDILAIFVKTLRYED